MAGLSTAEGSTILSVFPDRETEASGCTASQLGSSGGQTDASENGVDACKASGARTGVTDMDARAEIGGSAVLVLSGLTHARRTCTFNVFDPFVPGTNDVVAVRVPSAQTTGTAQIVVMSASSTDSVTATTSDDLAALAYEAAYVFEATATNSGAMTLAINGGRACPIQTSAGGALAAGTITSRALADLLWTGDA